jgi:hypothetical protein
MCALTIVTNCDLYCVSLKILTNRRHSWIGHIIVYNEFVVNILEGAIPGKKAVGRPLLQYLQQVDRNIEAGNEKNGLQKFHMEICQPDCKPVSFSRTLHHGVNE